MNKLAMTAAGILAGMAVAGTVGVIMGGKKETRRFVKKTETMMHNVGDTLQSKMHMK